MIKPLIAIVVAALVVAVGPVATAQEVNLVRNRDALVQEVAAKLLTDIYKKAGLTAQIVPFPGERATMLTLAGEKDGEVARVASYFIKNPTLVKVEPSYYHLTTAAFAKAEKGITIATKDDLKRYKVGIVQGVAHAEAATAGLVGVQTINTYRQLYLMLDAGRIDVAIDGGVNNIPSSMKGGEAGLQGVVQVGELARSELFHVLTPAKKDVAPKISAAIKALKNSGELAKMTKRYEEEVLDN
jgi:hypothetical protein